MAAQVVGAVAGAGVLLVIANGRPDFASDGNFLAANGFGADGSPEGYGLLAALVTEVVLTFGFLLVILGATDDRAHPSSAGIAIGFALTLIHLISIPVTNTSVNPARSTAVVLFAENGALGQLWLFWVAPLVGAAIGALIWDQLLEND